MAPATRASASRASEIEIEVEIEIEIEVEIEGGLVTAPLLAPSVRQSSGGSWRKMMP
jgi:hypothetical protein